MALCQGISRNPEDLWPGHLHPGHPCPGHWQEFFLQTDNSKKPLSSSNFKHSASMFIGLVLYQGWFKSYSSIIHI